MARTSLRGRREPALLSAHPNQLWKIQSRLLLGSHHIICPLKWNGTDLERQWPPPTNKPSLHMDITPAFGFWTKVCVKQRQSLWLFSRKLIGETTIITLKLPSMGEHPEPKCNRLYNFKVGMGSWCLKSASVWFTYLWNPPDKHWEWKDESLSTDQEGDLKDPWTEFSTPSKFPPKLTKEYNNRRNYVIILKFIILREHTLTPTQIG